MVYNDIFLKYDDLCQIAIIYFELLKGDRQTTLPGKIFNFITFFALDRP